MAEIAGTHSGRDHQEVVLELSTANSGANGLDGARPRVDALDLGQQHGEIFLLCLELPDRRRDLGWRQNSGGDLVEERLKNMMIAPIDQRDVDVGSLQR